MDDELPLTALAKPKKAKLDDDLPLSKLAQAGSKRPTGSSVQSSGKGKGKGRPKKAESSSSSSDDSDSSSSDSSSESGGKKKPRKLGSSAQRLRLIKKKQADNNDEDNAIKKKERNPKEQVVVDLLCRWWYAFPEGWPPEDPAYYEPKLKEVNCRRVSVQEWEWVADVDDKGLAKVYELSQFKGIFRKGDGEMVDLRPKDTCPSFNNFMKKEMSELYSLLVKAYESQLKDLDNSSYPETELRQQLNIALTRIRQKASQAHEMAMATGQTAKKQRLA